MYKVTMSELGTTFVVHEEKGTVGILRKNRYSSGWSGNCVNREFTTWVPIIGDTALQLFFKIKVSIASALDDCSILDLELPEEV